MPELPEVETLRRGLERTVTGSLITEVLIGNEKVLRGQSPETLRNRVVGRQIQRVDRRGKYLLLRLSPFDSSPSPMVLCVHLKMRGQFALELANSEPGKYHCVTLDLTLVDGRAVALRFYDMWTWGDFRALSEDELSTLVPALSTMGPEPLPASWNGAILFDALRGRKTAIKPTLLDQNVVAGVGNIYADEALHKASINPLRKAMSLTSQEVDRLAEAIKSVLTEAVENGGTTSDNFFDLTGSAGNFTPQVYERGGKPCHTCGTTLTRIRLAGRSAVFCTVCQPEA